MEIGAPAHRGSSTTTPKHTRRETNAKSEKAANRRIYGSASLLLEAVGRRVVQQAKAQPAQSVKVLRTPPLPFCLALSPSVLAQKNFVSSPMIVAIFLAGTVVWSLFPQQRRCRTLACAKETRTKGASVFWTSPPIASRTSPHPSPFDWSVRGIPSIVASPASQSKLERFQNAPSGPSTPGSYSTGTAAVSPRLGGVIVCLFCRTPFYRRLSTHPRGIRASRQLSGIVGGDRVEVLRHTDAADRVISETLNKSAQRQCVVEQYAEGPLGEPPIT